MPAFHPLTLECAPHSLWTPSGHSFSISTFCWLLPGHSPSGEAVQREVHGPREPWTFQRIQWAYLRTFTCVGDLEKQVAAAKNPINFEIGKRF